MLEHKLGFRGAALVAFGLIWLGLILLLLVIPGEIMEMRRDVSKPRTRFSEVDGYLKVGFDLLSSYPIDSPDDMEDMNTRRDDLNSDPFEPKVKARKKQQVVPEFIRALDGRKVMVEGFMIPMLSEKYRVLSFILAQSQMTCCFGIAPKLNQWIDVTMEKGKSTEWKMDVPITIFGTLSVGTKYDRQNKGWCLYRMVSDKVGIPSEKAWFY